MSAFIPVYYHGALSTYAWIDDEDMATVSEYRWTRSGTHATLGRRRTAKSLALPYSGIAMHRFILGLERGDGQVHHINEDGFDNRRENLQHVADKIAHGNLPHPRRTFVCGGSWKRVLLPPFEREIALMEIAA